MARSDAGTSSESEYQVFLNFRGPDTRKNFTSVLFHYLCEAGIRVFWDSEEIRAGERIDGSLKQAINNSKVYILVFSQTYASSKWCLLELMQILANTSRSKGNKVILPIFYDVTPDDVKLTSPLYKDAIVNLQVEKKLSNGQVDAWRKALMEVAAIKGWEAKNFENDVNLIQSIMERVVTALETRHRKVPEYLVGIDEQVEAVSTLLDVNSDDVLLIKIDGMGGIGKTTLARSVFHKFSSHFRKCCCFLEDVRAKASIDDDLVKLQQKLLSNISHSAQATSIGDSEEGMNKIEAVLSNKKVLIVVDNVDSREQVKKLVGESTLHSGSRIVITTRIKNVLEPLKTKYHVLDYEMKFMSTDCALKLFRWYAFTNGSPSNDYNDLSEKITSAMGGLPLALRVIGSFLHNKGLPTWQKTLKKLGIEVLGNVFVSWKISYDALTWGQQQIFLDIACFFIGEDKTNPIYMWEGCDIFVEPGIDALINMSLVKVGENNKFWMHDLLRDFGRDIVRQENQLIPGERSRLWVCKDILDTISTTEIKSKVQALDLDQHNSDPTVVIKSEEIGRFEHLRYLKLNWGTFAGNFADSLTKLKWMFWSYPPPTCKPTNMHFKNLIILELSDIGFLDDSTLLSLIEAATILKVLSLKSCSKVSRTPHFPKCLKLEKLTFEECSNLKEIDGSIRNLKFLIYMRIHGCNHLEDFPEEIGYLVNLKYFSVQNTNVKKLPVSIWKLKSLQEVHFKNHFEELDLADSWELPTAIEMLQKLEVLLINSPYLEGQLPSCIESLTSLRILDLSYTYVSKVPETVSMLSHLQRLKLLRCDEIQELPTLPTSLTHLQVTSKTLRVVPNLSNLTNLIELDLNGSGSGGDEPCTGDLQWIGRLTKLTKLSLGLHSVPVPTKLASLPLLKKLDLIGVDLETSLELPCSLEKLGLDNFNSNVLLPPNLRNLELFRSPLTEFELDMSRLSNIRELYVDGCKPLRRFGLLGMRNLKDLVVSCCPELVEIEFSRFESLETLCIQHCKSFIRLVDVGEAGHNDIEPANELISYEGRLILPLRDSNNLRCLTLASCPKILEIQIVDTSESMEYLSLQECSSVESLSDLSNLKNLKSLSMALNDRLQVVKGLNELEFLDDLSVCRCRSLESLIEVSNTKLPNHCLIYIDDCGEDFRGTLASYKQYKVSLIESSLYRVVNI